MLSFSADGADDFAEQEMKEDSPGTFVAEIPASATQGGRVDYFIEAQGDNDTTLASKGSEKNTLKITMLGPDGRPLAPPTAREEAAREAGADESPTWFFGLSIGSGVGWTTGKGEVNATNNVVNPAGFATSRLLHFAPEVGYFLSPDLMLSVQLRFQIITGATDYHSGMNNPPGGCGDDDVCPAGKYAFAGFARASYFFGEGDLPPVHRRHGGARTDPARRHVRVEPDLRQRPEDNLRRHRAVGPGVRRRGRRAHVQREPGVRAHARDQPAARVHEVHVPRRPERRRRVRVLTTVGRRARGR